MNVSSNALDRYFELGLPEEVAHNLHNEISVWLESCGPEWVVGRLKDLKTYYIHWLSGKPKIPTSGSWIAFDSLGRPKGAFKWLFTQKVSRKVFSALLAYTAFVAGKPTENQKKKFLGSIVAEPLVALPHVPNLKTAVGEISKFLPMYRVPPFVSYGWNENRRAPKADMTTCPEGPDVLFEDFTSSVVWDLLDEDDTQGVIADSLGPFYPMLFQESTETSCPCGRFVGRLSFIQEPGYKLRGIANPRRVFQVALRPLGQQLFKLLEKLPWDCTHDQAEGVRAVQFALNQGKEVYCVDLSDATNNFPLALQLRVLRWFDGIPNADIELFEKVSRGLWFVPPALRYANIDTLDMTPERVKHVNGGSGEAIQWTKGQPLGLYPSFPSFALTHGLLLRSIEITIGVEDTFRVLGDDVVIFDHAVYQQYSKFLNLLQVPVSDYKCINSDQVAEFGGMVITKKAILESWKWRIPHDSNRLSLTMSLPRGLDLAKGEEYLAYAIRTLPAPIGSGENPEGIPLEDRVRIALPVYLQWATKDDSLRLRRHTMESLWRETRDYLNPKHETTIYDRDSLDNSIALILDKWHRVHPYDPQGLDDKTVKTDEVLARLWDLVGITDGYFPIENLPENIRWRDSYRVATAIQSANRAKIEKLERKVGFRFKRKQIERWQERLYHVTPRTLSRLVKELIAEILSEKLQKRPLL